MEKATKEQIKLIKKNIDKMSKSDEQFIFMVFKNKDGTDNITQYSYNLVVDKLEYYFKKAINSGVLKEEDN